jgi:hypothetical protein
MIVDRPESHFIFVVPWDHVYRKYNYINLDGKPLTNKQYLESWGKWLVFGTREEMDALAEKLDPHVEAKAIPAIKYDRARITEFGLSRCVMCVYCHAEKRDEVWEVLASCEIEDKAWMFERETVEKWLPGGVNLEKWIEGKNLGPDEAEKVRQSSKDKFKDLFENEGAIFTGVDQ